MLSNGEGRASCLQHHPHLKAMFIIIHDNAYAPEPEARLTDTHKKSELSQRYYNSNVKHEQGSPL